MWCGRLQQHSGDELLQAGFDGAYTYFAADGIPLLYCGRAHPAGCRVLRVIGSGLSRFWYYLL